MGGGVRCPARVDLFPLWLLDLGPFAAFQLVGEYQCLLLAGRLALALATLGRRVLCRLQLRGHGPMTTLHSGQVQELCMLEIDVWFARRLLLALVAQVTVGLARNRVAELLRSSLGNRIFFRGTRSARAGRTTVV